MRWFLFLLSAPAFLYGLGEMAAATTVFQQIAGLLSLLIGAVLFGAAAIVDALVSLKQELKKISGPAEELEALKKNIRQSKPLDSGGHQNQGS